MPKSSFLSYVESGQLRFEEGRVVFLGHEMMFIPMTTQATLYHLVGDACGSAKCHKIFHEQGKEHITRILKSFAQQFDLSQMDIETFKKLFFPTAQTLGLGKLEWDTPKIFEGYVVLRARINCFANAYKSLYDLQKDGVDDFLCGIMVGVVEGMTKSGAICKETKCIAKGDPFCEFVTKPAK